ncbi:hypothetical protein [Novosphingobium sp. AP12]|uniref:hypothetical protein n=1 Tax=Novosphingobium sp. AP12 TaxID=1144305 RepID=UPI0005650CE0|nr:hypothetical protein [Novosphingobium sp. AP12]
MAETGTFRSASEDEVIVALDGASFGNWPQDLAGLSECFNRMIDHKLGETAGDSIIRPRLRNRCNDQPAKARRSTPRDARPK